MHEAPLCRKRRGFSSGQTIRSLPLCAHQGIALMQYGPLPWLLQTSACTLVDRHATSGAQQLAQELTATLRHEVRSVLQFQKTCFSNTEQQSGTTHVVNGSMRFFC